MRRRRHTILAVLFLLACAAGCSSDDEPIVYPQLTYDFYKVTIRHGTLLPGALQGFVFTSNGDGSVVDVEPWSLTPEQGFVDLEVQLPVEPVDSRIWTTVVAMDQAGNVRLYSSETSWQQGDLLGYWGDALLDNTSNLAFPSAPPHDFYRVSVDGRTFTGPALPPTMAVDHPAAEFDAFIRIDHPDDGPSAVLLDGVAAGRVVVDLESAEPMEAYTLTVADGGITDFMFSLGGVYQEYRFGMVDPPASLTYHVLPGNPVDRLSMVRVAELPDRMAYRTEYKNGVVPVSFLSLPADFDFPAAATPDNFHVEATGPITDVVGGWWQDGAMEMSWSVRCRPMLGAARLPDLPAAVVAAVPGLDRQAFECRWIEIMKLERVSAGVWMRTLARMSPELLGAPQRDAARRQMISPDPEAVLKGLPRPPASDGSDPRRTWAP